MAIGRIRCDAGRELLHQYRDRIASRIAQGLAMSVSMTIDHGRRLVISRFIGEMTNDDLRRQKDLIDTGGPYPGLYYVVADFTQITELRVTTDMLRWLAAQPSPIANARRVIVAPRSDAYTLAQLYQKESAETRPGIIILRSMDEAFQFLGIDMRKKPR